MPDAQIIQSRFRVDGMDCGGCATKIDTAIRRLPGVEDVSVSVAAGRMTVHHQPSPDLAAAIAQKVTDLGYGLAPLSPEGPRDAVVPAANDHDHDHGDGAALGLHGHDHGAADGPWWKTGKARLTLACGIALIAAFAIGSVFPDIGPWIFVAAMLVGLAPIARRALAAARAGTPFSIEMLMTIAAVGAVVIGAVEEAASVVLLFLIGELLEGVAAGRARASIRGLTALVPKTALLERDGRPEEVPAESLAVGSVILIRPGDRIPADGLILSGETAIDEAPVTGESTPKRRGVDGEVFAGTINLEAAIRVRVTAAAADNTIARIVRLVEEAQESKAPTERFIDSFSRWYTPGVVAAGALVAVLPPLLGGGDWSEWVYKGLAILLIGCPCALVISTPAAVAAALSAGARRGLLMKGGAVLESLGGITKVAFDKTGTLTEGKPQVTDIVGLERSDEETLRLAAALEAGSSHPLAKAILARAEAAGIDARPATEAAAIGGKGVVGNVEGVALFLGSAAAAAERLALTPEQESRVAILQGEGKTVSVLLAGGGAAGLIAMRDEPRPDAREGLAALEGLGVGATMLTGDNRATASAIGRDLGIEVNAELFPADKLKLVEDMQRQGQRVAKVGDGINDAPALAAATVGIAMGGGTDVALETADAAVLHGRVGDVAAMIALSRRTMRNIFQNITIALGLKAVFLVTTIVGLTGLWPAILADTGATVLVTANALRLLGRGHRG